MRQFWMKRTVPRRLPRTQEKARARIALLGAICLLTGLGIGVLSMYRTTNRNTPNVDAEENGREGDALSSGTMAVLERLNSTVEIRFYALLEPAAVPDSLQDLARRVDQLLIAYQRAASGKIKVTRHNSRSDASIAAAVADGLKPFNLDKGDGCYLGLVVVQAGRKELIPRLFPEWEQALEPDLSRAIASVIIPKPSAQTMAAPLPIDPATTSEVKRQIPNFASISLEEGSQILRESALKDLKAALSAMESQLKEAEQRVTRMQEAKSDEEKQAALKDLQRLQAEQSAKLSDAAARSSAQIEALRQIKEAAR